METKLANGFIWPSKSPTSAPILFDQKLDKSLHLCVDYQNPNNITIKNQYPLPPLGKSLDKHGQAKQLT